MDARLSLMELLSQLDDPRHARGKRHPLPALLGLALVATLSGITTYEGFIRFGKERGKEFLRLLGFTTTWGLCKATYSRVFRRIDVEAFEALVRQWMQGRLKRGEAELISIDGKTLRGSRDGETPGVHLVAAYAADVKGVLAQMRVDAKTNEHKAALELLGVLPLAGRVVTADAMFTHRDFCQQIIEDQGDYVLPIKQNQPNLRKDVGALFSEQNAGLSPPPDRARGSRSRAELHA
jgi:hypothetical protein